MKLKLMMFLGLSLGLALANPNLELILVKDQSFKPELLLQEDLVERQDFAKSYVKIKFESSEKATAFLNKAKRSGVRVSRNHMLKALSTKPFLKKEAVVDPPFKPLVATTLGPDPLTMNSWARKQVNMLDAWNYLSEETKKATENIIVAVTDTGVDYNHEDLVENMWRNTKEIPDNGVDDDNNGFIDDVVGWDFAANDNKPYDTTKSPTFGSDGQIKGANLGHGTHCAGNIAARANNGVGLAGIAPFAKIMAMRFITEDGEGTTEAAIKSIHYSVDNGARIISASWGGEGTPDDPENAALKTAIEYAQSKGVLFVVAAGNGDKNGNGYDMNSSAQKVYPASFQLDNILTVAASDPDDKLTGFSNFGNKFVHIAAPGHVILSTVPPTQESDNKKYASKFKLFGIFEAPWSGTSMATPIVSGAAALVWAHKPSLNYLQVKEVLTDTAKKNSFLAGKIQTGGVLDVLEAAKKVKSL